MARVVDAAAAAKAVEPVAEPAAVQHAQPSLGDLHPRNLPYAGRPDLMTSLQRLAGNTVARKAKPAARLPSLDALDKELVGTIKPANAMAKITALSRPALILLGKVGAYEALLRRVVAVLPPAQLVTLFGAVPLNLVWKLKLIAASGQAKKLNPTQWSSVVTTAAPSEYVEMRADAEAFKTYIQRVPTEMIAAWDKLEGLRKDLRKVKGDALAQVVNDLSPEQKAAVNKSSELSRVIIGAAGSPAVAFTIIVNLRMPLATAVVELDHAGYGGKLSRQQWAQLLAEASTGDLRMIEKHPTAGEAFRKHCPPAVRDEVPKLRGVEGDLLNPFAGDSLRAGDLKDSKKANALLKRVGAPALLAIVTQTEARKNYDAIKAVKLVNPILDGLPKGGHRLSDAATAGLRKWMFDVNESDVAILTKTFEKRFAVTARATSAVKSRNNDKTTNIVDWTATSLKHVWRVLERLPPAQVEGNDRLATIVRNDKESAGNAYYWGAHDDVVLGYKSAVELMDQSPAHQEVYWKKNPDGTFARDPMGNLVPAHNISMINFNQALRHEIGHAVDAALSIMDRNMANEAYGGWRKYGSTTAFVDEVVKAYGGMTMYPEKKRKVYRDAMIRCAGLKSPKPFLEVLEKMDKSAKTSPPEKKGPISVFWDTNAWSPDADGPWYNPTSQVTAPNGRRYQRAYDGTDSFCSYVGGVRDRKSLTQYQWRSPAEWFAEVYAVYYAENEDKGETGVGAIVRSRDVDAARLLSSVVDRGYAPQLAKGKSLTIPAPGVGRADRGGPS